MRRLVLLHGFAGQASSWNRVRQRLAPDLDVVAPQLPGHGTHPWRVIEGSFDRVVDAFADTLPPGPWSLVGYSLGARVALSLAIRHPGRVRRALLIGVNPGLDDEGERKARRAWDEHWAERIELQGMHAFAEQWRALPLFASQATLDPALLEEQQQQRRRHQPAALAWAMRRLGLGNMPAYWNALSGLNVPLRLMVGELDERYVAIAKQIVGATPSATLQTVPAVGHNLLLEAPETLARAMLAHAEHG
jgi:2-succinyl-6-hydroxy-2,4-cyclohexadiene-1-carboxylate synthase